MYVLKWCCKSIKTLLNPNPEKKKTEQEAEEVQQKLRELRDQMVFSFLMINSIWIVTMFLMQQYKDVLGIKWPLTATVTNIDWNPDDQG